MTVTKVLLITIFIYMLPHIPKMSLFSRVTGTTHLPKSNIHPDLCWIRDCNSQSGTCWEKQHIWVAGGGAGDPCSSERLHTLLIAWMGKAAVLLPTTSPSLKEPGWWSKAGAGLMWSHKNWMCALDSPCNLRRVQIQMVCSVREWLGGFTFPWVVILILDRVQWKESA